MAQRLREVPAAAVADQGDLPPGLVHDPLRPQLERVERAVRAVDVPADAGAVWRVAHPLEPAGHHGHRRVPGEEAGDQHHRAAVAARDAPARVDGVEHQPPELRLPAQLGAVVPPPAARRIGCGGRRRGGVEGLRHPRVPTSWSGAAYHVARRTPWWA